MLYPPEPSPHGYRTCPDCNGEGSFDESDCCGAPIKWSDICTDCKEHCSPAVCSTCNGEGEIPITDEYLEDLKEQSKIDDYEDEPFV